MQTDTARMALDAGGNSAPTSYSIRSVNAIACSFAYITHFVPRPIDLPDSVARVGRGEVQYANDDAGTE
jgi:hypothetical protein